MDRRNVGFLRERQAQRIEIDQLLAGPVSGDPVTRARWWLETFGKSLGILPAAPVRAILVGSPLNGTSLAAPTSCKAL
jgi:hypothetical protein